MAADNQRIERWARFEMALTGPSVGNPYLEVEFGAVFRHKHREVQASGFYDGEGVYRVRFMPDAEGEWSYRTRSSLPELDGKTGRFICTAPSPGNHGPVRVTNVYHFAYEDGTPYFPIGTTCYAWNHQGRELEEQTLRTLAEAPFNKIRMCVFPKHYDFNQNEPALHGFARKLDGTLDFDQVNPAFFRHLEDRVEGLMRLGIEADLILLHPYDRWGYASMPAAAEERYLRYVVARLAAYRNIWWSMANEYDLMPGKSDADWDRLFRLVQEEDLCGHLRSIHNCGRWYDHAKPWVTHASIQYHDPGRTTEWRQSYRKPVVVDECCYEGNINHGWGNIPAEELVRRFWNGFTRGGYVGHGETYLHPRDILWWSKGGALYGQSPARIAFLRRIVEESPGIDPIEMGWDVACGGKAGRYYLFYFGLNQPGFRDLELPGEVEYTVDLIDTWNMSITPYPGVYRGKFRLEMPGRPYMALRAIAIKPQDRRRVNRLVGSG